MANLAKAMGEKERLQRLNRALSSMWYLSKLCIREPFVLHGFQLTPDFHAPLMAEMDICDKKRLAGKHTKRRGDFWPRYYYKTTVVGVRIIRRFLANPLSTAIVWHAVEDKAQDLVAWVGRQFMENDELRALRPDMMPSKRAKKWCTASQFRFAGNRAQAPSLRAYGAGSEATGGHADLGILDDPVGMNDVEDSQMPFKRRWFGRTVMNVITPPPELWLTATRWDMDDLYSDWMKHRDWNMTVRGCYETDGKPDWNGDAVLYPREWIEEKRRGMSEYEFSCQMMNDPLPDEARMWIPEACEHYCTVKEAREGDGRIFVLSDPAPAQVGSLSGVGEKFRGDASKDEWAISVVRLRVRGQRREAILLDGAASRDWSTRQGLSVACDFMKQYRTNMFFNEQYGGLGADYTEQMTEAARDAGVRLFRDYKTGRLPRFDDSHASGAKNQRFEKLTDMARAGEFYICSSCPTSFVEGDGDKLGFLPQARGWRVLQRGRNSLRYDDRADIVSRCTDSALQKFAPKEDIGPQYPWWQQQEEEPGFTWGTRHVRV